MPPVFRRIAFIFAWFMGALWLPATQHCELEAIGLLQAHPTPDTGCCAPGSGCHHDGCDIVENPTYQVSNHLMKVPVPDLTTCTCWLCLQLIAQQIAIERNELPRFAEEPGEWVPSWHFERRAALSPRAPSLLSV